MPPAKPLPTLRLLAPARILVVDDGPEHLLAFKVVLAKMGYNVTTAEGYREGHAALRGNRFDLLISDLVLNGQRGQGLLLAEEAKRYSPPPSVLLLGSPKGLKKTPRPLRRCVNEYLAKPVSLKRLLAGVGRALKPRGKAAWG